MTHAAVPLAIGLALGPRHVSRSLLAVGVALAMLPDADVVSFIAGIPYEHVLGHRGASHAILTAFAVSGALALCIARFRTATAFLFLAFAMASHGVLDALTNGGLGPALFWPFSEARIFAPFTPIRVSPIGADFISARGVKVMQSELVWVWLPLTLMALPVALFLRRSRSANGMPGSRRLR
jgi:inner membrane protein